MLIVIDGTGPTDEAEYSRDMQNSFLHQIIECGRDSYKKYYRGPTLLGTEVYSIARSVVSDIKEQYLQQSDKKVFLAGYSRGGAVCVEVAQLLKANKWSKDLIINCMALFDAVDRDILTETSLIPENVENAFHAMRDPDIESRWYFGNCATSHVNPSRLISKRFRCTHAGMGGIPWTGDHPSECTTFSSTLAEETRVSYRAVEMIVSVSDSLNRFEIHTAIDSIQTHIKSIKHFCRPPITGTEDISNSQEVKSWMWNNMRKYKMIN